MGEYSNIGALGAVGSIYFFGGPLSMFGWFSSYSFSIKLLFHMFMTVWMSATFPSYRYDQFMSLCWMYLLPVTFCLLLLLMVVVMA